MTFASEIVSCEIVFVRVTLCAQIWMIVARVTVVYVASLRRTPRARRRGRVPGASGPSHPHPHCVRKANTAQPWPLSARALAHHSGTATPLSQDFTHSTRHSTLTRLSDETDVCRDRWRVRTPPIHEKTTEALTRRARPHAPLAFPVPEPFTRSLPVCAGAQRARPRGQMRAHLPPPPTPTVPLSG